MKAESIFTTQFKKNTDHTNRYILPFIIIPFKKIQNQNVQQTNFISLYVSINQKKLLKKFSKEKII